MNQFQRSAKRKNLASRAVYLPSVALSSSMSRIYELPGKQFARFGRRLGWSLLASRRRVDPLLLCPVSSVRYFEYDFAVGHIPRNLRSRVLDVSSPILFGFYLLQHEPVSYFYVNPDEREFSRIKMLRDEFFQGCDFRYLSADATQLPFRKEAFDVVLSLSVIEHISGDGDKRAIESLWSKLKPGGRLILTFPVSRKYEEEFRSKSEYGLQVAAREGEYFFQRYYDDDAIAARLLSNIPGHEIIAKSIYGEKQNGYFKHYEKRWAESGIGYTIWDPIRMARNMDYFQSIDSLPGMGVLGLVMEKAQSAA